MADQSNALQAQYSILIIEDDRLLSEMYTKKFQLENFIVKTASDGPAALQTLQSGMPNIVILDIGLPLMNGIQVLEKIREMPDGQNLPVITLTNFAEQKHADRAFELGVKAYMVKAMSDPKTVVAKVKEVLQNP